MPVVAVAGGSGRLGRAIVEALVAQGKYEVVVFSRETKDAGNGARSIAINYSDVDGVAGVLEKNNVEILISILGSRAGADPELVLIKAADKSPVTKRYIPSIWANVYTQEMASYLPIAQGKLDIVEALGTTSLEHTIVANGFFLDCWVAPKVKSYMDPLPLVLDIANNTAVIPGSGNTPVVFTYTLDIAKYTAALLTQPKWEKVSYIIGDKVTWNEFVKILEEAKGVKFNVSYDSLDTLKSGQVTELPTHARLYQFFPKEALQALFSAFSRMMAEGTFDFKPPRTLNEDFPEIKPRTVRELIFEAWKQ